MVKKIETAGVNKDLGGYMNRWAAQNPFSSAKDVLEEEINELDVMFYTIVAECENLHSYRN